MTTRDRSAAQRARALDMREQAARAAEQRLKQTATPPPAAAAAGGARGGAPAAEENRFAECVTTITRAAYAQFDELARIYQAMKPKAAAVVFEQLAMDVQVEVAQRMRERATAGILAAMSPKGAAALTMAIARRQAAPSPGASAQTAAR